MLKGRFECRRCVDEYAAVCTSVSKEASRLTSVGNSFEQQKTLKTEWKVKCFLLANIMEDTWLQISPITRNLEIE